MECPTLEQRVAEAEKNPHDHRNSREYREVFEAVRNTGNMEERNELVNYACDQLGITDDSRYVYQWMLTAHAHFGDLCHERELTGVERLFWKAHCFIGIHIMSRLDKTPRDDGFRKWLKAAHEYIAQKPSVKRLYVRSFYDDIAPLVISRAKD